VKLSRKVVLVKRRADRNKRLAREGKLPVAIHNGGGVWVLLEQDGYFERTTADGRGTKAWNPSENGVIYVRSISAEVAADRTIAHLEQLERDAEVPF